MYFNASTLTKLSETPSALDCQFRCKENSKCFFFSYTAGHTNLGKLNIMIYSNFLSHYPTFMIRNWRLQSVRSRYIIYAV